MSSNPRFIAPENRASIDDARQQFPNAGVEIDADDPLAALLRTLVSQYRRVDSEIDGVYGERFINSATGRELELLGANVGVDPRTGESEAAFRARVRAGYLIAISDGTFNAIARAARALFDADADEITLDGPPATSGGVGRVIVSAVRLDEAPLTQTEAATTLTDAAPLGHRIEVLSDDAFLFGESGQQGLGEGGLR